MIFSVFYLPPVYINQRLYHKSAVPHVVGHKPFAVGYSDADRPIAADGLSA
ncbi:hypothetical protein [Neisseria zalophi]|uniref:hypothetical protein n=1 Tax=Neisseria zalophi TaxID=640030 RepID=UPI00177D5F90|nr:hypothetical protein [Neisseria zalophi]